MPGFTKGPGYKTPFGKNVPYRSTKGIKDLSYTFAADTLPVVTVDGVETKVLQPGMVLAKITSGPHAGKVGPFQAGGTDEVQTVTKSGTVSGGTYTLTVFGVTTSAIAYNADAATVQAALRAAAIQSTDASLAALGALIEVTGGPVNTTALTVTFNGYNGVDVAQMTADASSLTGSTPGLTVATQTPGVAGATDGRQTSTNIVGVNKTFLPTQLLDRDVEVAAMYTGTFVQANCYELNGAGTAIALTNTTADYMRGTKTLDCLFV